MPRRSKTSMVCYMALAALVYACSLLGLDLILTRVMGKSQVSVLAFLLPVLLISAPPVVWALQRIYIIHYSDRPFERAHTDRDTRGLVKSIFWMIVLTTVGALAYSLALGYMMRDNEVGIAAGLAFVSLVCYLAILPMYRRVLHCVFFVVSDLIRNDRSTSKEI